MRDRHKKLAYGDMDLTFDSEVRQNLYQVIGCSPLSSAEQLNTEYRIRALACHPDKNAGNKDAEAQFKLLQEAKNILLDPESRKLYDKWLNSGVGVSYEKWLAMNRKGQAFHWVKEATHNPMIRSGKPGPEGRWSRETGNDLLNKFRNYEI